MPHAIVRIRALDINVTPLNASEVVGKIRTHAINKLGLRIGNFNLHAAYLYHTNEDFARYCDDCDVLLIDGWPIWLHAKLSSPKVRGVECRIGSSDWLAYLLETTTDPISIVAIGGTPEASSQAAINIQRNYPAVSWLGFDGYSSKDRVEERLADAIADADLILVGMGMPLQEEWIERNHELLRDKVVANVGGCIDYFAGTQKHAPRWMGKLGVEWLFRLAASPRRLWHRYTVEPFYLLLVLLRKQLTK